MLCLSELRGFIVCGSLYGKINGKISTENRNRKLLPIETMGRGVFMSICVWITYIKQQTSQSWISLRGLNTD